MEFNEIPWADSQLESIRIEYDQAVFVIYNDTLQKRLLVNCFGFAGITNLCIWDDTIIWNAGVRSVSDEDNDFVRQIYTAYDKNYDYGGRTLSNGLLEMSVELVNHISFRVYCQRVDVEEA